MKLESNIPQGTEEAAFIQKLAAESNVVVEGSVVITESADAKTALVSINASGMRIATLQNTETVITDLVQAALGAGYSVAKGAGAFIRFLTIAIKTLMQIKSIITGQPFTAEFTVAGLDVLIIGRLNPEGRVTDADTFIFTKESDERKKQRQASEQKALEKEAQMEERSRKRAEVVQARREARDKKNVGARTR